MLAASKHVVENDVILYVGEWVSRKATKELVTRANEQHKHQVKIYSVITLSLHLNYKIIKSMFCILVVLVIKNN